MLTGYIITALPEFFVGPLGCGTLRVAQEKGALVVRVLNLRDYSNDPHRRVDDYPFGGGPGMVLKPEPIFRAVESVRRPESRVILLSPQGARFDQRWAEALAKEEELILICGRYKGVDERVRRYLVTDQLSIGDYILAGGEAAALVVLEAVARRLPGVLGDKESADTDSFSRGILDAPYYTRPREFRGYRVPEVLLSGDHKVVRRFQLRAAIKATLEQRPDLLAQHDLSPEEEEILSEVLKEKEEDGRA